MAEREDGGPAFPFVNWQTPDGMVASVSAPGMTLRDWFAGQAIAVASDTIDAEGLLLPHEITPAAIAAQAYRIADAMLAARRSS